MAQLALTVMGKDRPGIVAEVSRVFYESGCNIEDTTMTLLGGEFTMILIASVPDQKAEKELKHSFNSWQKKSGLNCFWKKLPSFLVRGEKHPAGTKSYILSVIGKDRTGIVYETSRILAKARINITDLNSKILGQGKNAVFAMILEVDVPQRLNLRQLEPLWKGLRRQLGVDIRIRPLERLSL